MAFACLELVSAGSFTEWVFSVVARRLGVCFWGEEGGGREHETYSKNTF